MLNWPRLRSLRLAQDTHNYYYILSTWNMSKKVLILKMKCFFQLQWIIKMFLFLYSDSSSYVIKAICSSSLSDACLVLNDRWSHSHRFEEWSWAAEQFHCQQLRHKRAMLSVLFHSSWIEKRHVWLTAPQWQPKQLRVSPACMECFSAWFWWTSPLWTLPWFWRYGRRLGRCKQLSRAHYNRESRAALWPRGSQCRAAVPWIIKVKMISVHLIISGHVGGSTIRLKLIKSCTLMQAIVKVFVCLFLIKGKIFLPKGRHCIAFCIWPKEFILLYVCVWTQPSYLGAFLFSL